MGARLVVVGGGAAGMSAASAARRADRGLEVVVLEAGGYPSYGVCGLPYYLSGVIEQAEALVSYPVEEFRDRRGIDLRLGHRVTAVDVPGREVLLTDADGNPSQLHWDRLVWATGARPVVPPAARVDDPRVVTVRRLEDAVALRPRLSEVRRAVVVGAGYVGLETAEALAERGADVTVVDRLPRVMATIDAPLAQLVADEVSRHARLLLSHELVALAPGPDAVTVSLAGEGGAVDLTADLVVVAVGVAPAVGLLASEGARTGPAGALVVDASMRTSLPDVLAAGDAVAVHHRVLDAAAYVPLGPTANKTGRVAGLVAAGRVAMFEGIVGSAVVKVFDLTVAHTGLSEEQATDAGLSPVATDVVAKSRAKYYPGAQPLHVRLVHTADGRLLGGQLVGGDGAAQRVDVIAAALHAGLSVADLAAMDLAYAPPYSPVYDPLTQAANAALWATPRSARLESAVAR